MTNIVLIGMRGSGKSSVAKLLAEKLQMQHIEMDELVAQKAGAKIAAIVEQFGWDHFRDIESEVARTAALCTDAVISTGGGVIVRPENVSALKANGVCVFLYAPLETLLTRLGDEPGRPLLTGKKTFRDDLKDVWEKREALYAQAADETIDTEHLSQEEVATTIAEIYGR